jgi:hypothetical protein
VAGFKPSRSAWAISQFWQNRQWKLQPRVAIEKASVPGQAWNSGFFSIGSATAATASP